MICKFYNSDQDLTKLKHKIDYLQETVEYVKRCMDNITWRHQTIKNTIEWRKVYGRSIMLDVLVNCSFNNIIDVRYTQLYGDIYKVILSRYCIIYDKFFTEHECDIIEKVASSIELEEGLIGNIEDDPDAERQSGVK